MSDGAKRKFDDVEASVWECPLCLERLGDVVPMVSLKCGAPVAHVICLSCVERLPKKMLSAGSYVECPLGCRAATEFVPLTCLAGADSAEADEFVKRRRAQGAPVLPVVARPSAVAVAAPPAQQEPALVPGAPLNSYFVLALPNERAATPLTAAELRARRVANVLDRALEYVRLKPNENWNVDSFLVDVPLWEDPKLVFGRTAAEPRITARAIQQRFDAIVVDLQPEIDSVLAGADYTVTLPASQRRSLVAKSSSPVYLRFNLRRRHPPQALQAQAPVFRPAQVVPGPQQAPPEPSYWELVRAALASAPAQAAQPVLPVPVPVQPMPAQPVPAQLVQPALAAQAQPNWAEPAPASNFLLSSREMAMLDETWVPVQSTRDAQM